jgi:RNA polymerase sigma-70 factor, ECF subfamily
LEQSPPDDDFLLPAVARGDRDSFALLMGRHGPSALSLALRMTQNVQDAEEIVQEAFIRVWINAEKWNSDGPARFSTWLYRVVMNLCIDRKRRKPMACLDDVAEPPDPGPSGLDAYTAEQARKAVGNAMGQLPDRQRAAVSLCYFGEVGAPQAAEIMGVTVSALESLLVRGRKSLKEHFIRNGMPTMGDVL